MSSSKRRSLFKGLFGRKGASQPSGTASDSLSTAAAASTLDGAGASTAASAASANASGSENSAAALRNLENASQELHAYFREEGNSDASLSSLVLGRSRWVEKVQAYSNSSFDGCQLGEVPLDISQRRLIKLAALSATKVYAKPGSESLFFGDFKAIGEPLKINADRFTGSVKAATVQQYTPNGVKGSFGNVLVVAIRGSVSTHDWMINLNDGLGAPITDPFMVRHSAGGAVAAMLYAHFTKCGFPSDDRSKSQILKNAFSSVNCITFGAPPITTRPLLASSPNSICLSIVNDGDPVPRADSEYIPKLLCLFCGPMPKTRTSFELPPRLFFNAGQVLVALHKDEGTLFVSPNESGVGSLADTVMGDKRAHSMKVYRKRVGLEA
ncbi:lipase (class 3) domain-containing protein [Fusarium austroafricanum]|uniref:Lipase (Class 3) domain-containing protein n=1 Tax=Fusarium austroafricanum TaxID=2364996 RepID=A0A8H4JQN1_9HYPO|nr:lipase (class 3) domain-containing protein [Fusarium austroafricanum]